MATDTEVGEIKYEGKQYKLRAGAPMPIAGSSTAFSRGKPDEKNLKFVLHTFMAELSDIAIYACKTSLPFSSDFRGQGGNYVSANFSRLNVKYDDTNTGGVFSGKIVTMSDTPFVDEDDING